MKNIERTKEYFNSYVNHSRLIKETKQSEIPRQTGRALESKLKGVVLDIGSGGRVDYPTEKVGCLISLDISLRSLANSQPDNKIRLLCGDAGKLPLKEDTFDQVVMIYTIHHLAGETLADSYENLGGVLRECYRVLKKSGRLLIVDTFSPRPIECLEKFAFSFAFRVLSLLKKPMVYFYSLPNLIDILKKEGGFKHISVSKIDCSRAQLCPFNSSIGIPFKYVPLFHSLVEGVK